MRPELGRTAAGAPLVIDLARLIETRLLLQANSGAGKGWALRRILEQTHGQVLQLVLDVEDEFYTLRESFDYVLAGRAGADCPADPRSAKLLARKLLELGTSAIISLNDLKVDARREFVKLFLEQLVDAPVSIQRPTLVVLDEAHAFAPQGEKTESTAAVIDLMARGRKRGLCGILATQRISKIHKDAVADVNNKLIGRSALDVDMKRAADELGFSSKEDQLSLRTLPDGNFYCFGPALSITVQRVQVGETRTSHRKAGQGAAPAPPARDKVKRVLAQLADLPREADQEIRNLASAQARIAALERELKAKPKPPAPVAAAQAPAPKPKLVTHEVPMLKGPALANLQRTQERAEKLTYQLRETQAAFTAAAADVAGQLRRTIETYDRYADEVELLERGEPAMGRERRRGASAPAAYGNATTPEVAKIQRVDASAPAPREDADASGLPRMQRAFLKALAQRPAGLQKFQVLLHAGYKSSGDTSVGFAALTRDGLISVDRGLVKITPLGLERLGSFTPLPKGKELRDQVLGELGRMEAAFMRVLFDAYPEAVAKGEILGRAGYKSSGDTSVGFARLVRLSYAVPERATGLRAAAEFFEE